MKMRRSDTDAPSLINKQKVVTPSDGIMLVVWEWGVNHRRLVPKLFRRAMGADAHGRSDASEKQVTINYTQMLTGIPHLGVGKHTHSLTSSLVRMAREYDLKVLRILDERLRHCPSSSLSVHAQQHSSPAFTKRWRVCYLALALERAEVYQLV